MPRKSKKVLAAEAAASEASAGSTEPAENTAVASEPVAESNPAPQDKFEVVTIGEKKYKKFSRPDGTTDVELIVE